MANPKWLGKHDNIVAAYAEIASGPGWSNTLVWCVVRDGDKKVRLEALQPEEQSAEVRTLFDISAVVHGKMLLAVLSMVRR
jgi:hypothetical protein